MRNTSQQGVHKSNDKKKVNLFMNQNKRQKKRKKNTLWYQFINEFLSKLSRDALIGLNSAINSHKNITNVRPRVD